MPERSDGSTLSPRLRRAIVDGDVAAVAWLARSEPRLSVVDPTTNLTPLMLAIEHDHLAVAEALLQAGADVNAPAAAGWTALHHAVDAEADGQNQTGEPADPAIVELLLRAGADPRAVYGSPSGDETPGQLARAYGWTAAAELLGC